MALSLPVRPTLSQPSSAETPPKAAVQSARLCLLVVIGQAGFISSQELGLERPLASPLLPALLSSLFLSLESVELG